MFASSSGLRISMILIWISSLVNDFNSSLITLLSAAGGTAQAEWGLNFPEPAAGVAREIYDIHMLTMTVATCLLVIVFAIVTYALFVYRKSRGYEPDLEFHKSWFGRWSWVLVPAIVEHYSSN